MGFCVFGNLAIATKYAQWAHGLQHVFIIDFDVHYGNGTNDALYDDPDIFFLSTHQGDFLNENHLDSFCNVLTFDTLLSRVLTINQLLISFRYDEHVLDPLANFQFTTRTYFMLASNIKQLAKELYSFRAFVGEPSMAAKVDDLGYLYDEPSFKVKQAIQRIKHLHFLYKSYDLLNFYGADLYMFSFV
ncbi:putative histone deacetylase [Helianthus debilis subsp. tardiflorus]